MTLMPGVRLKCFWILYSFSTHFYLM